MSSKIDPKLLDELSDLSTDAAEYCRLQEGVYTASEEAVPPWVATLLPILVQVLQQLLPLIVSKK